MQAAIDVGSNTLRMLISTGSQGPSASDLYLRRVTRLSGGLTDTAGLTVASMQRTLEALQYFQSIMAEQQVEKCRAVATEALRRAVNRQQFLELVAAESGLNLEIISGEEEARLTTAGVLSVISPLPQAAIIIDIGGGSTELICVINGRTVCQKSYPLGVVRLCEECASAADRQEQIAKAFDDFYGLLKGQHLLSYSYQLIGTAGSVTTLAAIHLELEDYAVDKINNHLIPVNWLEELKRKLELLTIAERETLPGMEVGRGDLIIPGIEILLCLSQKFSQNDLRVSDSGLLEGILLNL